MKNNKKVISLVAINAKFIHTNVAILSIKNYAESRIASSISITCYEFTTQDNIAYMLGEITDARPDVVGFSCYIWNIGVVKQLVAALKKIAPDVMIVLGGPEVIFDTVALLAEIPADIIVCGEGEAAFTDILLDKPLEEIAGIVYRAGGAICANVPREKLPPSAWVFPYTADTLPQNKIIYYESSRGCPFTCGFCLSHGEKPVRYLPLERVLAELDFFLQHRVNQVKFTDRTFNCDRARAVEIWRYLIARDNGHTNFHFEIAADLLDEAAFALLQTAPVGLFQFEIGVQSTHAPTLAAIRRHTHTVSTLANIARLADAPHIHVHLDLIAGLPQENYAQFAESFNAVYALQPHMLQLGFLKLLKGAQLRIDAEAHGLIFNDAPPYEVLATRQLTYDELKQLKRVEGALDRLYNAGHFARTLAYVVPFFATPFAFYEAFAGYWHGNGYHRAAQGLPRLYEILHDFARARCDEKTVATYLKFDWYATGNQKSPPVAVDSTTREDLQMIADLYKSTDTSRRYPIVQFDFDPRVGEGVGAPVFLRFTNYGKARQGAQIKCVQVEQLFPI